jgi:hypothetical protein
MDERDVDIIARLIAERLYNKEKVAAFLRSLGKELSQASPEHLAYFCMRAKVGARVIQEIGR